MFIVNVEGAILKEGKWLIIERSKKEDHAGGLFSLVGGKVELEGNSSDILERTLKREIMEEVGIEITDNIKYVHSTSFVTDRSQHVVDIVFLCEYSSGEAFAKCPDEVESIMWLSSEEVYTHSNAPIYLKESIQKASLLFKTINVL